jgi:hypothetical protein
MGLDFRTAGDPYAEDFRYGQRASWSYSGFSRFRHRLARSARSAAVNCTYYPDTLTHEVSNEYSPHWVGPMLYDTISTYTEAREFNGRIHRATTRFTVGYTVVNWVTNIYAMVLKVI